MKAKLIIEGKEFEVEILDSKPHELIAPHKNKTGYEISETKQLFTVNSYGKVVQLVTYNCDDEESNSYLAANYYSDRTVAENNARADTLMRQLRRFAVEHRACKLDWSDHMTDKWEIYYDH